MKLRFAQAVRIPEVVGPNEARRIRAIAVPGTIGGASVHSVAVGPPAFLSARRHYY
jgi:hypothetical protein